MRNLFEHTSASWVHYADYEWKKTKGGHLYLMPAKEAKPTPYDPMKNTESLVLSALDIGLKLFYHEQDGVVRDAMRDFARAYGLLGIMTALPTTAKFINYEKVYFPHNEIIKGEAMETMDYLKLFFPFHALDFKKDGMASLWNTDDRMMMALMMTYQAEPQAMVMSFMRDYGERFDWLASVFKDWTFTFITSFLYYHDKDTLDEETLDLYRKGMAAFDGNAPTYHLELRDKPTLVWDFHSLLLNIKMMFSIMLTDENNPLRLCRQCSRPFIAPRSNSNFCSPACRDKYKKEKGKNQI